MRDPVDLDRAQNLFDLAATTPSEDRLLLNIRQRDVLTALRCNAYQVSDFTYQETADEPGVARMLGQLLSVLIKCPGDRDIGLIGATLDGLMAHGRWRRCMQDYDTSLSMVCTLMYLTAYIENGRLWFAPRIFEMLAGAMADPAWPFPWHSTITGSMLRTNAETTFETLYLASIDPVWLQLISLDNDYMDQIEMLLSARPPLVNTPVPDAMDLPDLLSTRYVLSNGTPS